MALTSLIRPEVETEVARIDKSVLAIRIADLREYRTLAEVAAVVGIYPKELSKIESVRLSGSVGELSWVYCGPATEELRNKRLRRTFASS